MRKFLNLSFLLVLFSLSIMAQGAVVDDGERFSEEKENIKVSVSVADFVSFEMDAVKPDIKEIKNKNVNTENRLARLFREADESFNKYAYETGIQRYLRHIYHKAKILNISTNKILNKNRSKVEHSPGNMRYYNRQPALQKFILNAEKSEIDRDPPGFDEIKPNSLAQMKRIVFLN